MNFLKKSLFIACAILCPLMIHAQGTIEGIISDNETKEPIPYANIIIEDTYKGTISTVDGSYRLFVSKENQRKNLLVSSIGYRKRTVSQEEIIAQGGLIELELASIVLQEVVISSKDRLSPSEIIENVIKKMGDNFHSTPYEGSGVYREWVAVNGKYAGYAEVIGDFHSEGMQSKIFAHKSRYLSFDCFLGSNYRRTYYASKLTRHGMARTYYSSSTLLHEGVYFLKRMCRKDFFKQHKFEFVEALMMDDEEVYVIKAKPVSPLSQAKDYHYKIGEITFYVGMNNFGLHKTIFSNEEYLDVIGERKKPSFDSKSNSKLGVVKIGVNYVNFNNEFYPSHVFMDESFSLFQGNDGKNTNEKIREYKEIFLSSFVNRNLSHDELKSKYNKYGSRIVQSGNLRYMVNDLPKGVHYPYSKKGWKDANIPPQPYIKEIQDDLSKYGMLQEQFDEYSIHTFQSKEQMESLDRL